MSTTIGTSPISGIGSSYIPELSDTADIQAALKLLYYGQGGTASTTNGIYGSLSYLKTSPTFSGNVSVGGNLSVSGNLTAPNITGNTSLSGNLSITGNLSVTGTNTVVNTTNLSVTDSIIYLASNQYATDSVDIGFYGAYGAVGGSESNHKHTGLVRDHGTGLWHLFSNGSEPSGQTVDLTDSNIQYNFLKLKGITIVNSNDGVSFTNLIGQNTGGVSGTSFAMPNTTSNTSDLLVSRTSTDTLTNKTLTSPIISTIVNSGTLTLPTSTDTLVGRNTTDTLTNKTFDTGATGNVFKINGTQISDKTGTGKAVLDTAPTINSGITLSGSSSGSTQILPQAVASGVLSLPATTGTVATTTLLATNLFGDGSDGAVSVSSGTTTLTKDMFYSNLTITGTGKIDPAGFKIFVSGTLDLSNAPAGAISHTAATGNAGTFPSFTSGGAAIAQVLSSGYYGNLMISGTGGDGKLAMTTPIPGGTPTTPTGLTVVIPATASTTAFIGSAGGAGSKHTSTGANNGNWANGGSAITAPSSYKIPLNRFMTEIVHPYNMYTFWTSSSNNAIWTGAAGSGGGGANGGLSGNYGSAGASGGQGNTGVFIYAKTIIVGSSTADSVISFVGGTGGAGTQNGDNGYGGGGGGGQGGLVYIAYGSVTGSMPTNKLINVSGGTGGAAGGQAVGGQGGASGLCILFNLGSGASYYNTPTAGGTTTTATAGTGTVAKYNLV